MMRKRRFPDILATRRRLIAVLSSLFLVAALPAATNVAAAASTCQVGYSVSTDWGTGFTANIVIKNTGPAISSWALKYSYAGNQQLQQGWSGTWSQSGQQVTVANTTYNGSLATGASVQAGANFNYSGTNTAPATFTLNGATCNGS